MLGSVRTIAVTRKDKAESPVVVRSYEVIQSCSVILLFRPVRSLSTILSIEEQLRLDHACFLNCRSF